MGIINVTPDSFYSGSRTPDAESVESRVRRLVEEGADILDIGAYSSRPGADDISPREEMKRLRTGMEAIRRTAPDTPVSVDTFRADVARYCVEELGADIINDISGGMADSRMFATVATLKTPYILMHMRGTPQTMQQHCNYSDVTAGVIGELSASLAILQESGVTDIIIDPGFGFSKNLEQNYKLLSDLPLIESALGHPLLVGVSRKSMIFRPLGITPDMALNGTTVINTIALLNGAAILRVHDVAAARQAITLTGLLRSSHTTLAQ